MKRRFLCAVALLAALFAANSCSTDDDGPVPDPAGTVTLNMMDEDNGRTSLGESSVYINRAANFQVAYSPSYVIADLGPVASVGNITEVRAGNPVREAAVTAGHGYQIFDVHAVHRFPSGVVAAARGCDYYCVRAESLLTDERGKTAGAVVKYFRAQPRWRDLPADGGLLAEISRYWGGSHELCAGDFRSGDAEEIEVEALLAYEWVDGAFVLTGPSPLPYSGDCTIRFRAGETYTEQIVRVRN